MHSMIYDLITAAHEVHNRLYEGGSLTRRESKEIRSHIRCYRGLLLNYRQLVEGTRHEALLSYYLLDECESIQDWYDSQE